MLRSDFKNEDKKGKEEKDGNRGFGEGDHVEQAWRGGVIGE